MEKAEGFLCVGRQRKPRPQVTLFGKNTGGSSFKTQNFCTNGLTPFSTIEEATEGFHDLKGRMKTLGFYKIRVANIDMEIAQSEEEIKALRYHRGGKWVTLQNIPDFNQIVIFGKFDEKALQVGYIGTDLRFNGLKPFTNFESALNTAREIRRQAQSPAQIASFYYREVPLLRYQI